MLSQQALIKKVPEALASVELSGLGVKHSGKVRDIYLCNGKRVLVTTDRVSAFDRVLGLIPYKGQVLNQLSLWWFAQMKSIVANHVLDAPDPNVTVAREAQALPVEVVVRGYITGVTDTSMWTLYERGNRKPYGIPLPAGLQKNDPLPEPVITPTTKAQDGGHDERITRTQIIERGLIDVGLWEQIEQMALALFAKGQAVAADAGLVLVDTKYEFGLVDGELVLIDEVHTPDSSRYWVAGTHDHHDKEYLRQWFASQGYKGDGQPPVMPPTFAAEVAGLYITTYEKLTGKSFSPAEYPAAPRIDQVMQTYEC